MDTDSAHFVVTRATEPGPVVVEVPHAGLEIDEAAGRFTRIPPEALAAGALLADSDLGSDHVWDGAETRGVTRIVARASRYVIDLNTEPRLPTPYEEKMPAPMRSVLRRSLCGRSWRDPPVPKQEIERRVREVFEPYHARVAEEIEAARAKHGAATLIASHTFPEGAAAGADVVLGTLHGAAASEVLRDLATATVCAHGFSVAHEAPFAGGYASTRHARRAAGVSVLQIEVARALLRAQDGDRFALDPEAVARVRRMLVELAESIARHVSDSRR